MSNQFNPFLLCHQVEPSGIHAEWVTDSWLPDLGVVGLLSEQYLLSKVEFIAFTWGALREEYQRDQTFFWVNWAWVLILGGYFTIKSQCHISTW